MRCLSRNRPETGQTFDSCFRDWKLGNSFGTHEFRKFGKHQRLSDSTMKLGISALQTLKITIIFPAVDGTLSISDLVHENSQFVDPFICSNNSKAPGKLRLGNIHPTHYILGWSLKIGNRRNSGLTKRTAINLGRSHRLPHVCKQNNYVWQIWRRMVYVKENDVSALCDNLQRVRIAIWEGPSAYTSCS